MSKILEQYEVHFYYDAGKTLSTINTWLTCYISDHYHLREANRLLSGINSIISSNDTIGGGFPTQSLLVAVINSNTTKIYQDIEDWANDNTIEPEHTLPTADFKEIVEAWKEYLAH